TEPYGYIIKPFEEDDIRTAIEIAYYKYTKDLEVINKGNRFASALDNLDVAIIITDATEKIIFLNKMAEGITGSRKGEAIGKDITIALKHSNSDVRQMLKNMVRSIVGDQSTAVKKPEDAAVKISNGVSERELNMSTFPIFTVDNKVNGAAFVLTG